MKRALCILLFCALLLTGCGGEPTHVVNDLEKDEPIRIVATIQSSSPITAAHSRASASAWLNLRRCSAFLYMGTQVTQSMAFIS